MTFSLRPTKLAASHRHLPEKKSILISIYTCLMCWTLHWNSWPTASYVMRFESIDFELFSRCCCLTYERASSVKIWTSFANKLNHLQASDCTYAVWNCRKFLEAALTTFRFQGQAFASRNKVSKVPTLGNYRRTCYMEIYAPVWHANINSSKKKQQMTFETSMGLNGYVFAQKQTYSTRNVTRCLPWDRRGLQSRKKANLSHCSRNCFHFINAHWSQAQVRRLAS